MNVHADYSLLAFGINEIMQKDRSHITQDSENIQLKAYLKDDISTLMNRYKSGSISEHPSETVAKFLERINDSQLNLKAHSESDTDSNLKKVTLNYK